MSPRRRAGRSRDGLFVWTTDGDVQADELHDNPLLRPCPHCKAAIGDRCRRPSRRGWVHTATHDSRTRPLEPQTPVRPPSVATDARNEPQP